MFDYLGWCSWDAFYTDISEEKVREKAQELKEKNVPVRWMLLDDGWQSVHGQLMYDLMPEKEKFPEGFAKMIRDIKEHYQLPYPPRTMGERIAVARQRARAGTAEVQRGPTPKARER